MTDTPYRNMRSVADVRSALSPGWHSNKAYFLGLALYSAACVVVASIFEFDIVLSLYAKSIVIIGIAACVFIFSMLAIKTALEKPEHLLSEIWRKISEEYRYLDRIIIGIPIILSLPIFFSEFTSMKMSITRIIPFYADHAIIKLEREIFGMDSWEFIQPIFGFHFVTFVINFFYNIWAFVLIIVLLVVAFSFEDAQRTRERFLLAYVLLWGILGGLVATLGASVGPVYVDHFFGDASFAPLIAYLEEANRSYPIWALQTQAWLLERSSESGPMMGSGISAFPSMHVAVATLYPLYFWNRSYLLRLSSLAFLCLIFIGSIHLGWHYAADGVFSIVVTVLVWRATGFLVPHASSSRSELSGTQSGVA